MRYKLLLVCCLLSAAPAFAQKEAPIDYKQMGAPMPPLLLAKLNGDLVENKDVNNKANLLVMMFNPTCSHCEDQTQKIEDSIALFKKSRLLLVAAPSVRTYLPAFEKQFNLPKYPMIILGIDSSKIIDNLFLYQNLPQINIYDKNRKLIKTYTGGVPIDSLKQYIQ